MSKKDPPIDALYRLPVTVDGEEDDEAREYRLRKRIARDAAAEARERADELVGAWAREAGVSSRAEFLGTLFPGDRHSMQMAQIYVALHLEIMKHRRIGKAELAKVIEQLGRDFGIPELDSRLPETSKPAKVDTPSSELKLPDSAPELWSKRKAGRSENPAQFLRRVYGRWLNKGLSEGLKRKHLAHLDPPLYRALGVWLHRHPEDEIEDLPLNTDDVDRQLAALAEQFSPDELRRLGLALQSRLRRMKQ